MNIKVYVLAYFGSQQQKYVALDDASGGYPYQAPIHGAKFFNSLEEAEHYNSKFKYMFIIKEVNLLIKDA